MRRLLAVVLSTSALAVSVVVLTGVHSRLLGQEATRDPSAPAAVYRKQSTLVLVDAVVTDKHDRPVLNLSRRDFTVYEDDVPQTIQSLQVVTPAAAHSVGSAQRATAAEAGEEARAPGPAQAEELRQYLVLFLDYATTQLRDQIYIRAAAKRYFSEHVIPNMQVAVVRAGLGLKLVQNFTSDSKKIVAALGEQDPSGTTYAGDRQSIHAEIGSTQDEEVALQEELQSVATGSASSDPRAGQRASFLSSLLAGAYHREARLYATEAFMNQQQTRPVLEGIRAVAHALAPWPGRKTLILVSRGFSIPTPLEDLLYRAVDDANRARLAIYALDSSGLEYKPLSRDGELHHEIGGLLLGARIGDEFGETVFDRAREVGSDQGESTLRYLAGATGGLAIRNTNDFEAAFERIAKDTAAYYLLSYRPTNSTFDGGFRRIRVAANRPGLEVRARAGYFAIPAAASGLKPSRFQELIAAARGSDGGQFPFFVAPAVFLNPDGGYRVELPMQVPLERASSSPEMFGVVRDVGGDVVASFPSGPAAGSKPAMESGFWTLTDDFRLEPGTYAVEVMAFNPANGQHSYRHLSLQLEPVGKELAVSSLVLSHHVEGASTTRARPWTVGKLRVLPTAERRFHNGQDLVFYFDVYYPALRATTGRPDVHVDLSLVREGRPVDVALPPSEVAQLDPAPLPHAEVARYLKLAGLAPGSYLLRATVHDRVGGGSTSTQASFELVP